MRRQLSQPRCERTGGALMPDLKFLKRYEDGFLMAAKRHDQHGSAQSRVKLIDQLDPVGIVAERLLQEGALPGIP